MMNLVTNDSVTAVATVVVTGVLVKLGNKFPKFGALLGFVKAEGPTLIKDAEHLVEDLAKTPAGIAAEHALKKEVDNVSAHLHESRLISEAATALHAFGQSLSKLSEDQKKAIIFDLASVLPDATRREIEDAMTAAQQQSDAKAASPIYVAANQFTAAQQQTTTTDSVGVAQ